LLLRKEIAASLHKADRAIALNPFDARCRANMGANTAFARDWARGCAFIERSMDLNPQHPVWYRGMLSGGSIGAATTGPQSTELSRPMPP
jgi:hypothetical protein